MEHFFRANRIYAVAGASSNPAKFGFKVLQWYKNRNLLVVPINPKPEPILGLESVASIADIRIPSHCDLALSVVTPPFVTKKLIDGLDSSQTKLSAIWLQPGTYDDQIVANAQTKVPVVITDCILVNGNLHLDKANL